MSIPTQLMKAKRNSLKLTFPFLSQSISSAYFEKETRKSTKIRGKKEGKLRKIKPKQKI